MTTARASLLAELLAYTASDAHEEQMRERMIAFVSAQADALERSCISGHITVSTWIVDRMRSKTLLTHHRKLRRWLQLGGHLEGDVDVRTGALREAREESGLDVLRFASDAVYDVDIHYIPARGSEAAHEHYDVRFALEADADAPLIVSDESHELAWIPLDALERYGVDESVLRLARKTAALPLAIQAGSPASSAGTPAS